MTMVLIIFYRLTCEIILEISTVGNVARAINTPTSDSDLEDPFIVHEDVLPHIASIMEPHVLFETQMRYTCPGRSLMKKRLKAASSRNGQPFRPSKQSSRPASVRSVRTFNDESTSKRNSLHNVPPHPDEYHRPSGEYGDINGLLTGSSNGIHHDRLSVDESRRSSVQLPSPTLSIASPTPSIASSLDRAKSDMFQNKQTLRRKRNNIMSHPSVTDPSPISRAMIRNLTNVVFRDNEAALMVMKFLARVTQCEDIKLQNDFFSFLMLLLELNPRNKQLLCLNQGVTFIIELLFLKGHQRVTQNGYHYETEMPPYVDLVAALATYSITNAEVALLFDAAYDPLGMFGHLMNEGFRRPCMTNIVDPVSHDPMKPLKTIMNIAITPSAESDKAKVGDVDIQQNQVDPFFMAETQMQMLYAMERISERTDPAYYFGFDGCDGTFITFPLDKFPPMKIGYTVTCWIKVTTFLSNETGVLCFEDPLGDYALFELYFRTLDMSNRQCLCVRMQHHPLPPEDFVFDGFDFSDTGVWHHIVFVHGKQGTSLFVDGTSISAYSTFSYPRPTGKEKPFCAVLGRRGKRLERSMSSIELSPIGRPSLSSDVVSEMNLERRGTASSLASEMNLGRRGTATSLALEMNLGRRGTVSSLTSSLGRPSMSSDALSSVNTQATALSDGATSGAALPRASTTSFSSTSVTSPGLFCGQMGCVYIMKGLWDQSTAEKVYNEGPGYAKGYRALGIDNQHATVVHPLAYVQDPKAESDRSSMNSIRSSFTSTDSLTRRSWDSLDVPKVVGRLDGGCSVHRTLPMKDIVEELGGVELAFRFLEMEPHQHLRALRTISNLLYKHSFNQARFLERRSYQTLEALLKKSASFMTAEHFDVLWDIVSNGVVKSNQMLIVNVDALRVIVDVVVECEETVQLPVIRTLVDMLVELPENLKQWRFMFGLETLFEMLNALTTTLRPFIMRALGAMVEDISIEELTRFFDFITHDQRQYLDVKAELLEMVFRRMTYDSTLVERVRTAKNLPQLIPLLELPNERFRMTVLRVMGVLMSSNAKQSRALMLKINGFDGMRVSLAPFPLSLEFAQVLSGVALNHYYCDPGLARAVGANGSFNFDRTSKRQGMVAAGNSPRTTSPRVSPRSSEDSLFRSSYLVTEELMWPELMKLLIELLRTVESGDLVYHILTDVKRLLNEENMKVLWEHPWFEWISRFLQYRSMMGPSNYNRIHTLIDSIIQKMMVFDLSRKTSYISKSPYRNLFIGTDTTTTSSSNSINDDMFQISIIENVLSYLDKHPNLNVETASYVFRNLVSLYKHLEAVMADNPVPNSLGSNAAMTAGGGVGVSPAPSLSSSANPHNRAIVALANGIGKARRHFAETINLLACHNTSVIRTTMKSSGLFRIRDGLVKEFGLDLEEQGIIGQ
ncbi:hypothetical protein BC936DRAFT_138584 [Jimgerdemannia flammicorona]|uniref:DUF4704 domain-containing protein n=1 Tax=Jimgerdemannia flammicorona TaxID=994334 RepID=A0A433C2G7_9FUNG|nr:hypothetical protein BC936DRAFT_138584 [Jimgerdemannia flammicorona]